MIADCIDMLGKKGRDKVSGFKGVIASVSFDLYGCVQVVLSPPVKDGDLKQGVWFDIHRVEIKSDERVMDVPDFEAVARKPSDYDHGPAEKPAAGY